jgi:signal peptidase I
VRLGRTGRTRGPESSPTARDLSPIGAAVSEGAGAGLGPSPRATGEKRRKSALGTVIETLIIVGAAFAIAMVVQTFMFRITGVLQTSMLPNMAPGDRIVVNCLTYHFREPKPGEVVVIHDPLDDKKDIVKRIIALGGDTIEVSDGVLYVDGVEVDEPYVVNIDPVKGQRRLTIPDGYVYVMGDNRPVSGDSRDFGPVAEDRLIGKVICIMWPIGRWKGF